MNYAEESLKLHEQWKGKIEVTATVPVETENDLSLAYTPGVAQPCLEIQKNMARSYDLTRRHNLCADFCKHFIIENLLCLGIKVDFFIGNCHCIVVRHNAKGFICPGNGGCVVLSEHIGKRKIG